VILDSAGAIRFVISKRIDSAERQESQLRFIKSETGAAFWTNEGGVHKANCADVARRMCSHK
jgi:hypothetical protein